MHRTVGVRPQSLFSRRLNPSSYRAIASAASTSSTAGASSATPQESRVGDQSTTSTSTSNSDADPNQTQDQGYFKITLLRSAIGLGERKKASLTSLGIHRRMQTVFHPHKPEFAGKILAVKELVRVENVRAEDVRTKTELRRMRRPEKGFEVVGRLGAMEGSGW